jgi:hypothetical protein
MNNKVYILTILTVLLLSGCQNTEKMPEIRTPSTEAETTLSPETSATTNSDNEITGQKFKLLQDESFSPAYLTLNTDGTFSMDFNSCHSMIATKGTYTQNDNTYTLNVLDCENCNKEAQGIAGVKIELQKNSNNELVIQNPVTRNYPNSTEEVRFCAPDNTEGYNTYQSVQ